MSSPQNSNVPVVPSFPSFEAISMTEIIEFQNKTSSCVEKEEENQLDINEKEHQETVKLTKIHTFPQSAQKKSTKNKIKTKNKKKHKRQNS